MNVTHGPEGDFFVEFESEEELRREYAANLVAGGLRVPTERVLPAMSTVPLTLGLYGGSEYATTATVVGVLPGGLAFSLEGKPPDILDALLVQPAAEEAAEEAVEDTAEEAPARAINVWDRIRALTHVEKMLLAPRADRQERAILLQDSDPQVLYSLLKNPRITGDEVVRLAKSAFLSFQTAELLMKTPQLLANMDVKIALVHNPRTPPAFALRLVPSLSDPELKKVARAATSQALKRAALKRLQGEA